MKINHLRHNQNYAHAIFTRHQPAQPRGEKSVTVFVAFSAIFVTKTVKLDGRARIFGLFCDKERKRREGASEGVEVNA